MILSQIIKSIHNKMDLKKIKSIIFNKFIIFQMNRLFYIMDDHFLINSIKQIQGSSSMILFCILVINLDIFDVFYILGR